MSKDFIDKDIKFLNYFLILVRNKLKQDQSKMMELRSEIVELKSSNANIFVAAKQTGSIMI